MAATLVVEISFEPKTSILPLFHRKFRGLEDTHGESILEVHGFPFQALLSEQNKAGCARPGIFGCFGRLGCRFVCRSQEQGLGTKPLSSSLLSNIFCGI